MTEKEKTNKSFDSVDSAYKILFNRLHSYAKQHLWNQDQAIDMVHEAFSKALEHKNKNPEANINEYILFREVMRACRRYNKHNDRPNIQSLSGFEDDNDESF